LLVVAVEAEATSMATVAVAREAQEVIAPQLLAKPLEEAPLLKQFFP
jgi:hypothetical protein